MKTYNIKYIKNEITISEEINNELIILKRKAEDSQPYEYEDFWSWWKEKVEYNNEKIQFNIDTDNPSFKIHESIDYKKIKPLTLNNIINETTQFSKDTQKFTKKHSQEFSKSTQNFTKIYSIKSLNLIKNIVLYLSIFIKNIFGLLFDFLKKKKESYDNKQQDIKIKSERRL